MPYQFLSSNELPAEPSPVPEVSEVPSDTGLAPEASEVPSDTSPAPQVAEVPRRTAPGRLVSPTVHLPFIGEVVVPAETPDIDAELMEVDAPVEIPTRAPLRGFARLAAYLHGKELLILGPGNSGKTKFAQYLRLATLDPEGIREMTCAVTKSPAFVLNVGGEEGIELKVRRTVDTCGQIGPLQHALLVARRRPHVVIVMLDCSVDPRSMVRWLCLFCDALDSIIRKLPSVGRRLQEMVVILNKRDKIDDREYARLRQATRKALERFLTVPLGAPRVRAIPILACISVQTARGTALIDRVIAKLAERLIGRQERLGTAVGQKIVAVSPASPLPGPSRPSSSPAATPPSPPAGRQEQPGAPVARRPVAAWTARFHPCPPRPARGPAPTPSSGPGTPATPAPPAQPSQS